MPGNSSALITFVETSDPRRLLAATAGHQTSAASAALVSPDLDANVFAGADNPLEVSHSMRDEGLIEPIGRGKNARWRRLRSDF
jgi:hypothetical protein